MTTVETEISLLELTLNLSDEESGEDAGAQLDALLSENELDEGWLRFMDDAMQRQPRRVTQTRWWQALESRLETALSRFETCEDCHSAPCRCIQVAPDHWIVPSTDEYEWD